MDSEHPLRPIVGQWISKIRLGMDFKKRKFGDDAEECTKFFNGPYGFMYDMKRAREGESFAWSGDEEAPAPRPGFLMTVNKVAEMVQLFGPTMYHRNPVRQVNPRKPPMLPIELFGDANDPRVQMYYQQLGQSVAQQNQVDAARAILLEHYLNYTPTALDLKTESRWAVDEAIIKGMGLLWPEVYTPSGSPMQMFGSFYDTVDNLVIDPDVEKLADAKWIARRCVHAVWEIEREYGLQPGSLKGNYESYQAQAIAEANPDGDYYRKRGLTNDLLVYWKVYSKMGMGGRLTGSTQEMKDILEGYGDYCFLAIAEHTPYPLNLSTDVIQQSDDQAIMQRVGWPTPFWADDAWPFVPLVFHSVPRSVWPMSHLKPGLGELKFLNWVYSFVAGKIKTACRDFIAVAKSASEDVKTAITTGQDYTLIEIEKVHGTISEVVQFLQHPEFNGDIWKVTEAITNNFEKRVGLNELMYGASPVQFRSAAEANVKQDQTKIRPDDMANTVEDWMTAVSRLEALGARWHLQPQDVQPVFGPVGAQWWAQFVTAGDPREFIHQLEYRIEAGSARKPNKDRDANNMQQAMQNLFQPLFQYAMQTGQVGPVNALLTAWAKSLDMEVTKFLLQPPPPPPMPPPGPGGPPQQGNGKAAAGNRQPQGARS
jgi:hypothetical protein